MSFTITKTGKRDDVAGDIEAGDHHAGADQSQFDSVRAFVAGEIRAAATPDHDVHVTISGHSRDAGIDPARQFRRLNIEIVTSPDPSRTAGALGLDNRQLNVPGLTTETVRAAETVRTDTPHLGDGPDADTKVVGGPRTEATAAPPPQAPAPDEKVVETPSTGGISAPGLVELAQREQSQGQVTTQNILTDEQAKDEQGTDEQGNNDNTEVKADGTEMSPADEAHEAGQDHLVGASETVTPAETVKDETGKDETGAEEPVTDEEKGDA